MDNAACFTCEDVKKLSVGPSFGLWKSGIEKVVEVSGRSRSSALGSVE